jgi:hypothetical protein
MKRFLPGRITSVALLLFVAFAAPLHGADDVKSLLAAIKAVGKEGAGNPTAARAWRELSRLGPDVLPAIFAGFDDDNPLTTNWLRAAADAIGDRALREKKPLPAAALERFVQDTNNPAIGRLAAYRWLVRADPAAPARLLPGFLHDRSPDLRRDAVDTRVEAATAALAKGDKTAAIRALREALSGATDKDQVEDIAKSLKEQGIEVDLAAHFGFIRSWLVIGPFDNAKGEKLAVVYAPEKSIDLQATYKGKGDVDCRWKSFATNDPYGKVDFNKALGQKKGVIAYAQAVVEMPAERRAEIHLGCATGLKVFHNGKELLFCDEYFHGIPEMDQFVVPVVLKAGRNEILIKVGQSEETGGSWADQWWFQARLCDASGVAVSVTSAMRPVPAKAGAGE